VGGKAAATLENSQPNFCVERKEKQRKRARETVLQTEKGNPVSPTPSHPTSALTFLKGVGAFYNGITEEGALVDPSAWRGTTSPAARPPLLAAREFPARSLSRAGAGGACGKAIRNPGSAESLFAVLGCVHI
jgi:hypothetical protein